MEVLWVAWVLPVFVYLRIIYPSSLKISPNMMDLVQNLAYLNTALRFMCSKTFQLTHTNLSAAEELKEMKGQLTLEPSVFQPNFGYNHNRFIFGFK